MFIKNVLLNIMNSMFYKPTTYIVLRYYKFNTLSVMVQVETTIDAVVTSIYARSATSAYIVR